MIDKHSPIPLYYQLEEHIKALIDRKDLKPGDPIPSEREYADLYQISRMTVRQAITNLVNERYLYRIKGKGTFVAEQKIEQHLQGLTSFTEDMKARGMVASSQLIAFDTIPATRKIAESLKLAEHDPVYLIKRIRLAAAIPMALERTYIPEHLVSGLTKEIVSQSLYNFIEKKLQLKIEHGTQMIEAAIANSEEIDQLDIESGSPILLMQRNSYLADGTAIELVKSSYRADRYKFMIDLHRH